MSEITEPVHPNVPLDGHAHKPGEHCQGCADLFAADRPIPPHVPMRSQEERLASLHKCLDAFFYHFQGRVGHCLVICELEHKGKPPGIGVVFNKELTDAPAIFLDGEVPSTRAEELCLQMWASLVKYGLFPRDGKIGEGYVGNEVGGFDFVFRMNEENKETK